MKRIIQIITVLIIVLFSTIVLFDELIVKRLIISSIESITNKKTELEKVNIYYFPDIRLELIGFKMPNPYEENYLITSNKLGVAINLNQLLLKKLVISNITSSDSNFFDNQSQIKTLNKSDKINGSVSSSLKSFDFFKEIINKQTSSIQLANISTSISKQLSFVDEYSEIDAVINQTTAIFSQKKDKGLNLANEISYSISQINIENTKSLTELETLQKKFPEINKKVNVLESEITSFNGIYEQSLNKVNDITATINQKIEDSFSFNVLSSDGKTGTGNVDMPTQLLKNFISSFIKKEPSRKQLSESGVTHYFSMKDYPNFYIEKIEINSIDSPDYLNAKAISFDENYQNKTKIYFKQTNKADYKKLILKIYGQEDQSQLVEFRVDGIRLPSKSVYNSKELQVNIVEQNTSNLIVTGNITQNEISLRANFNVVNPTYRVINKQPNEHPIASLMPYFSNKNIEFIFEVDGPINNLSTDINTNLISLMSQAKESILNNKIAQFEQRKKRKINELRKIQESKIDQKKNYLKDSYSQAQVALKFQHKELLSKTSNLDRDLKQKKVYIQNSVKSNVEDKIKKIKIN